MKKHESGMIFAYMRVSLQKERQKTDRQRYTIEEFAEKSKIEIDEYVTDKISGGTKAANRPNYAALKAKMRRGDVLILCDVDRLGRDSEDVLYELNDLRHRGTRLVILDVPYLDSWETVQDDAMSKMAADMFITVKAHYAEQERTKIRSRVKQGMVTAKSKGVTVGRPKVGVPAEFRKSYEEFISGKYGNLSAKQFYTMMGVSERSFYYYKKAIEEETKKNSEL